MDHDGLEDGRPVIYDGKVIAPKDDEPWERCGLSDSWKEHIASVKAAKQNEQQMTTDRPGDRIATTYAEISWEEYPEEEQWWITGFTGRTQKEFIIPNPAFMVLIGTVDLSERPDMYEGLKHRVFESNSEDINYHKYVVFDDYSRKVWINFWGKGVK